MSNFITPVVRDDLSRMGALLKGARIRRGMKVGAVASRLGVSRNTITSVEKGGAGVGIGIVMGLLWLYGLDKQVLSQLEASRDVIGLSVATKAADTGRKTKGPFDDEF